jgi:hypothetical protein
MWIVKTNVIPIIIETIGTTSKSFRKYLSNTTGENKIKELQKTSYWSLHTYSRKY